MAATLAEPLEGLQGSPEYRGELRETQSLLALTRLPLSTEVEAIFVFCAQLGYARLSVEQRERFHSSLVSALAHPDERVRIERVREVLYDGVLAVARKLSQPDAKVLMDLLDSIDPRPADPQKVTSEMISLAEDIHAEMANRGRLD